MTSIIIAHYTSSQQYSTHIAYLYPHVGDTGQALLGHLFYSSHGESIQTLTSPAPLDKLTL